MNTYPVGRKTFDKKTRFPVVYQMLIFLTLGNFMNASYSPLNTFIQSHFLIDTVEVGLITSAIFIGSITVSFISGYFVDRFGPYSALKISFGVMSLGAVIIVFSSSYIMLILGYYAVGFGYGIVTPSTNSAIMKEYQPNHSSRMGIKQAGVPTGAALSAIVLAVLALHFSLLVAFITVFVVGAAVFITIPKEKEHKYERTANTRYFSEFLKAAKNRSLVFISGTIIFMSWAQQSLLSFFVLFEESEGFSRGLAEVVLIVLLIGSIFGRLFWGFMGDRILGKSRIKLLSLIMALSGFFFVLLNFSDHSFIIAGIFAFMVGMNAVGWNSTYVTMVSEIAPKTKVGLFSGFSFVIIGFGTVFGTPLSGFIKEYTNSFQVLWSVIGIALIVVSIFFVIIGRKFFRGIDEARSGAGIS